MKGLIDSEMNVSPDVDSQVLGESLYEAKRAMYENRVINKIADRIDGGKQKPQRIISETVLVMVEQVRGQFPEINKETLLVFAVAMVAEIVTALEEAGRLTMDKKELSSSSLQAVIVTYINANADQFSAEDFDDEMAASVTPEQVQQMQQMTGVK